MKEVHIHGASDDLIEIVGDLREELYANYGEPTRFRVGEWEIKATYNRDGEWIFDVTDHPDGVIWTHLLVGESDEYKDYSEVVKFDVADDASVEKL